MLSHRRGHLDVPEAPLDDQLSPLFATWIRSRCDRNLPVPVASVIRGASAPLSPLPQPVSTDLSGGNPFHVTNLLGGS